MTDYYPLISRAVAGLEKSTGESRRQLYERARTALVNQLRGMEPPLPESEITKHRLGLEEAIRKIEADIARQARAARESRMMPPQTSAPQPPVAPPRVPEADAAAEPEAAPPVARPPAISPVAPAGDPTEPPAAPVDSVESVPDVAEMPEPKPRRKWFGGSSGMRDVVADAEDLGDKTANAAQAAREAYGALPSPDGQDDRREPRMGSIRPPHSTEGLRRRDDDAPHIPAPGQAAVTVGDVVRDGRRISTLTVALIAGAVLLALLFGLMSWKGSAIVSWFGGGKAQVEKSANPDSPTQPAKPKIADRVSQDGSVPTSANGSRNQVAQVAQRVVLYEEDPAQSQQGKRLVGSVIWRTETVSNAGQPPDVGVRGDIEIAERRLGLTLTLRRNADATLPASHTLELLFNIPSDFAFGGVQDVPGLLMKANEQARGAPLAGLRVKVTDGFFIIGLTAVEAEKIRNIQLLKERGWIDIPLVYKNGRRAIMAIEKGTPGERAFTDAFNGWGQ